MNAKDLLKQMKDIYSEEGEILYALKSKKTGGYLFDVEEEIYAGVFVYPASYGICGNFLKENFGLQTNTIDSDNAKDEVILNVLEQILINWELVENIDSNNKEYKF